MNNKGFYVYCYVDDDGIPLYIGKAVDMIRRYKEHLKAKNREGLYGKKRCYVTELNTKGDMEILEKYLIAKEKPYFNIDWVDRDITLTLDLSKIEWKLYEENDYKYVHKEKVLNFEKKGGQE